MGHLLYTKREDERGGGKGLRQMIPGSEESRENQARASRCNEQMKDGRDRR